SAGCDEDLRLRLFPPRRADRPGAPGRARRLAAPPPPARLVRVGARPFPRPPVPASRGRPPRPQRRPRDPRAAAGPQAGDRGQGGTPPLRPPPAARRPLGLALHGTEVQAPPPGDGARPRRTLRHRARGRGRGLPSGGLRSRPRRSPRAGGGDRRTPPPPLRPPRRRPA